MYLNQSAKITAIMINKKIIIIASIFSTPPIGFPISFSS